MNGQPEQSRASGIDFGEVKGKLDMLINIVQRQHEAVTGQLNLHTASDQIAFDSINKRVAMIERRVYTVVGSLTVFLSLVSGFVAWMLRGGH